jgi:heme-degrading monooxygenase HmoA
MELKGAGIMCVALTLFTLGPGKRELADPMGQQFRAVIRGMKGFKSMTMFGDSDTGEYGGLSIWETKADAEAALVDTEKPMKEAIGSLLKGPPVRKVFELWEAPEG